MRLWRTACLAAVNWARFIVPTRTVTQSFLILWDHPGKYCHRAVTVSPNLPSGIITRGISFGTGGGPQPPNGPALRRASS